jgi:hypothetical protein
MKRLIAAIAAVLRSSVSYVWERCKDTGNLVARAVTTILPGGGGGGAPDYGVGAANDNDETVAATAPGAGEVDMRPIRELAAAIVNGGATEAMCAKVDERTFNWLSNLSRGMIAKILMASDDELRSHLRGKSTIKGLLQADEDSVNAFRQAWLLELSKVIEPENEPRLAQPIN